MNDPKRAFSLFEAMCAFGDPELVAEMLALKDAGADAPCEILGSGTEHGRQRGRYLELRKQLEHSLDDKVAGGDLVVRVTFVDMAHLNQEPTQLSGDLWSALSRDFDESTAELGGRRIIGIHISDPAEADGVFPYSDGRTRSPKAKLRLVISASQRTVKLDGRTITLSPRPFSLLLTLAQAAVSESGPLEKRLIAKALWGSTVVSERAVSDAIRDLRESLGSHANLIQTFSSQGYELNLTPDEILIR